ncbi:hypothetical protein EIN_424350 [Entamoeba invadens IP1]|uniref:Ras-GEF domain-containing protein n=1 Tax=Entamoeba invadens IP1 TaxID=370355 RepID=A0A0A1U5T7_ENTIV|nr:hypothetical protein EIN_424350 [Entamoeba invadens IP1]ELP89753.1 hypothetical protein EIN_424350 [Entamoeba invadens IP1]|eukprot:XP_004256524.1 hypothetical protein EIN_424350 [Entamoeba invadens IP1]
MIHITTIKSGEFSSLSKSQSTRSSVSFLPKEEKSKVKFISQRRGSFTKKGSLTLIGAVLPIQLETFLTIPLDTKFNEFIEVLEIQQIYFFQSITWFSVMSVSHARTLVWSMESSHRLLFECVVKHLSTHNLSRGVLSEFLFKRGEKYPNTTVQFLHYVFCNLEFIFNENSCDDSYTKTGVLLSETQESHWNNFFEIPLQDPNVFVLECAVYLDGDELFKMIMRCVLDFEKHCNKNEPCFEVRRKRIQDLLMAWTDIFRENVPRYSNVMTTKIVQNVELFDPLFVHLIKKRFSVEKASQLCLAKIVQHKRRGVRLENMEDIETQIGKTENYEVNFFGLKPPVVAMQLVLFDQNALRQVKFADFYSKTHLKTLQNYLDVVKVIERMTSNEISTNPSRKIFSFFIKVSYECVTLGDYNIAFFIYSSLIKYSMSKVGGWSEIGRKTKGKWNDLKTLFSIARNSATYRKSFEEHVEPKIPIIALLMGDMVRLNDMDTLNPDGKLNMVKMSKFSNVLGTLLNARQHTYPQLPDEGIQNYLNHYTLFG